MVSRVVFLGNHPWSAVALEALAGPELDRLPVLAITRVPLPVGRGSATRPTEVAQLARRIGIPVREVETVRSGAGLEAMRAARPDVLLVVAYGELLPPALLGLAAGGAVNLHLSLLPRWRGASPVQHTILAGDQVAGASAMLMDEGLDTGPLLAQIEEPVRADDDAGSLGRRLAASGGVMMRRVLKGLAEGSLTPWPQPEEGVTAAPKLTAEDRRLDWAVGADLVGRRVRAFAPEPGAMTVFRGDVLKVFRGEPALGRGEPGTILPLDPATEGVPVATADGVYLLREVAPAGRRRMAAADWARGARFAPGERLG